MAFQKNVFDNCATRAWTGCAGSSLYKAFKLRTFSELVRHRNRIDEEWQRTLHIMCALNLTIRPDSDLTCERHSSVVYQGIITSRVTHSKVPENMISVRYPSMLNCLRRHMKLPIVAGTIRQFRLIPAGTLRPYRRPIGARPGTKRGRSHLWPSSGMQDRRVHRFPLSSNPVPYGRVVPQLPMLERFAFGASGRSYAERNKSGRFRTILQLRGLTPSFVLRFRRRSVIEDQRFRSGGPLACFDIRRELVREFHGRAIFLGLFAAFGVQVDQPVLQINL